MRALLCLPLLLLAGCENNRAALQARQTELDRQLAEAQATAAHLNEFRNALDAVEVEVTMMLEANPAAREAVAAVKLEPTQAAWPPLPPLPPEGTMEGVDSAKLRATIAQTEMRLQMVQKILGEVHGLQDRKRQLERQLAVLKELQK